MSIGMEGRMSPRRMMDREWPPDPDWRKPPEIMVEVLLAVGLFVLAPLASWFWAALPGGSHPWSAIVWPVGWAAAAIVLLVGNYIRARKWRR